MRLYNSLSRRQEELQGIEAGELGMYTCGPTVYSTATIGNWRTYVLSDLLARSLEHLGYRVRHVMNLTDVGHLTGDNEGDSSQGEDRLEKAAKKEGKTAWEISREYAGEFEQEMKKLNIKRPSELCRATDHISEQIKLVEKLEDRGFVYKISDGMYFDTKQYEMMGNKYGELSNLDEIKLGGRLEPNLEKRDLRDFALWKFSPTKVRRDMEWDSPWGVGFPGWHVECSAMSMKYLGEQFSIHVGGEDLKSTHHPNEIAQSEGATGKSPFVKTWVHGAFLLVDGGRMGKSLGNAYTIADIEKKGFDPLSLRYFYLTGNYRRQINFTWNALESASTALSRLRRLYQSANEDEGRSALSSEKMEKIREYQESFRASLENDLDMPGALAVAWEVAKSNIPGRDKAELLLSFDQVLGLDLDKKVNQERKEASQEVSELINKRDELRNNNQWAEADKLRDKLLKLGHKIKDDKL